MNRYPTLSLIVIAILFVGLFLLLRESKETYWDFRNNVWAVARLVLEGKAPADEINLAQLSSVIGEPLARGIWSPTITLVALPLGVMDWQSAGAFWLMLNIVAVWGLVLMAPGAHQPVSILVLSVGMTAIFPPTLSVLKLGQVSLLITVISLLALCALAQGRGALAGGLITMIAVKPQMLLFIIPLMAAWAFRNNKGRQFISGICYAVLGQLLALSLLWPDWFDSYRKALGLNPEWDQPNLLSLLAVNLPFPVGQILWSVAVILVTVLLVTQSHRSLLNSGSWALALTPLFAPYAWSWDLVLMLPLLIQLVSHPGRARWFISVSYTIVCAMFVAQRLLTENAEAQFLWVAPLILLVSAGGQRLADDARIRQISQRASPRNMTQPS